ncbi:flagellar hook-length control protein FliK [Rhodopseudomonas pseudopalustris]|uniref:Hook-length control protein FliK n=1 Tax=Rhodopseudomonas pseudopalustris TaxID=1513892 RepID=A0A1H8V7X6_9BRAD|nr:flagellar hook-length control protein FliK [Rhodopseudomonas pseudopalustris]SEP11354.1 hook-length control protein FliK [Rhodopseudomonas pseudopalustris]
MAISVNPNLSVVALQGVTADVVLQPGTVVQAKVLSVLDNNQVRIAIAGQTIDATAQIPLQAGQILQVAVSQTDQGIRLAIVNQPATTQVPANLATAGAALDTVTLAPQAIVLTAQSAPSIVPAANALTPQQAAALTMAAQVAATQQTGLSTLFANLDAVTDLASLPQAVRQAVTQVLAQRSSLTPALTGADIQRAFQSSGILLEASLATGAQPATAGTDLKAALIVLRQVLTTALGGSNMTTSPQSAITNPPTPLLQGGQGTQLLAQTALLAAQTELLNATGATATPLATATSPALASLTASTAAMAGLATDAPEQALIQSVINQLTNVNASTSSSTPAASPATTAATLSALQEALQANPQTAVALAKAGFDNALLLSLLPATSGARVGKTDDNAIARTNTPPPPIGGALPAAQPVMPANLNPHAPLDAALRRILAETEGSLARQTLLQVASLPDRADVGSQRLDATQPRWSFEIPFATPHGTAVAQFEISRDGGDQSAQSGAAASRVWRARFSLDVEPAGPVHALISLQGEKTSVRMWAERPSTAAQLRAGASQLSVALSRAELTPGDIIIRDGSPTPPPPAPAGHFLDRAL